MTIDVRPTEPHEYRQASDAMAIALMVAPASDERWEQIRPTWDVGHSYSAWDGDRCVGHATHVEVETTVPGGARLSTGAVGRVGVSSTHRRLGIGRRLMEAVIDDAHRRGRSLMSLRASEATIYGRFGFGVAGDAARFTIDTRRARPVAVADVAGSFRILDRDEVVEVVEPLHDRVGRRRCGAISRPPSWTRRLLRSAVEQSEASFVAVHVDADGTPDGYVHYDVSWTEDGDHWTRGTGRVHDLVGATDAVDAALWRFVLDIDLVDRWTADARPVDDVLCDAVHDRRSVHIDHVDDEQWLRLVDVDAALRARTFASRDSVTIAVRDPLIESNCGTWRISVDGAERVTDDAELSVDVAALSATFLGGRSWRNLAAVGAITMSGHGAVERADALFATPTAPFCGTFF